MPAHRLRAHRLDADVQRLVLLMTPGLALFYGGMARSKSVLNMMMMSFGSIGAGELLWAGLRLLARLRRDTGGVIGDLDLAACAALTRHRGGVPHLLFVVFQLMFAIITAALISGAIADRVRFAAWLLFVLLWATLVYFPVAHWVWGEGGWLSSWACSTTPAARRCTSRRGGGARPGAGARQAARLAEGADAPAQPADGGARRRRCCGSAGSASTPARRSTADASTAVVFLNTQVATAAAVMGWLAWSGSATASRPP